LSASEVNSYSPHFPPPPPTLLWSDEFPNDVGYTFTSGNSISGGVLTFQPASTGDGFVKSMGISLPETFTARFHGWKVTSLTWAASFSFAFGFQSNTTPVNYLSVTEAWGIDIFRRGNPPTAGNMVNRFKAAHLGSRNTVSGGENGTNITAGVKYYVQAEKLAGSTGTLSIFTDSAFTTLATPVISGTLTENPTLGSLTHFALAGQSFSGTQIIDLDKVEVWDSTPP
jgi:hypothetical protein